MTGSAVSDKNRKGISLYLVFLLWSHWSASHNKAQSLPFYMAFNYRMSTTLLFFDSPRPIIVIVKLTYN